MESIKKIISINGPVVIAKGNSDFGMHDMVLVGNKKILGEVIKLFQDSATIQVYESTSGLKIGEDVISMNSPLSLTLAPGLIGNIFDGIERPLNFLREQTGDFITAGSDVPPLDLNKLWNFIPLIEVGERVSSNSIIGEVQETTVIKNRIMIPNGIDGIISNIVKAGNYKINDTIAIVKKDNGESINITMIQKWAVRKNRPYKDRLPVNEILYTGQKIIDSIFPIAKGGTAMVPGGFGTGKTVLQHQLAKWCNADIIVYIGCGERGNEMTDVLEEFSKLIDPKTQKPLMERTILIANTSNMPVAAREASIYTGVTMAEYYRDMGYNVAIMADSTSRWAEALREISGRLEEMPAEEGFPSYLPSRLSEFYGRAGRIESYNGNIGTITIIGAVSPQSSDFSEPVTQNTQRFVHVFWALDRDLAYSRHYPAINWNISYSDYSNVLQDWYNTNVDKQFTEYKGRLVKLLEEENELLEISKVVGQDILSDSKKLVLETCKAIRIGFLQQSALNEIEASIPLKKQYRLMKTIINLYDNCLELIEKAIPLSKIDELNFFEEYMKLKYNIGNSDDDLKKFDDFDKKIKVGLRKLEVEYNSHI